MMSHEILPQDRKNVPCTFLGEISLYEELQLLRFRPDVLDRWIGLDGLSVRSACGFLIAKSYSCFTEAEISPMVGTLLTDEFLAGGL